jgi:hypothetical protein
MRKVHIRFTDADQSLAVETSFLSRLVGEALESRVVISTHRRARVDIQLTSVQYSTIKRLQHLSLAGASRLKRASSTDIDARWNRVNPIPQGDADTHIWFTGENVRPPSEGWDATLSFDVDDFGGINAYLPLWWYSVGVLGPASSMFMDPAPDVSVLANTRVASGIPDGFVVAFINNPHPMRFHAIKALSRFGPVDVFGRAVGRALPNKASLTDRYRFMLCFENDLYPGYVTEKAIEAWALGAVPLWWGSDPSGYLNPAALVNAASFPTLAQFAEAVSDMARDESSWMETFEKAILLKAPNLSPAMDLIRRVASR